MRKKIYLAIVEALRRAELAKFVSLWNEDLDGLEKVAATEFPAVYVEFTPIRWGQRANRVKGGQWRINIHILTSSLASPEDGSPTMDEALEVFEVIDSVVGTVQGVSGEGFNQFMHVETMPDHAHADIQHDVEGFVCEVEDTSAVRKRAVQIELKPMIKPTPAEK